MLHDAAPASAISPGRRQTVRAAVRGLLEANPEFARVPPERRRQLAHDLVALTETSLDLMAEEAQAEPAAGRPPQLAASLEFDGAANRQLASAARDTLEGIAFPRFVTELVNGVFKGLIDANAQQIQSYVDMISGVTAATAGSSGATGAAQARLWLVQQFPEAYELGASQDDWGEENPEGATVIRLREGREAPSREDVAALLELEGEEAEGFDTEEPEEGLLARVRAYLSRKRQKVIASLLTLGMNRLVIDHGKIKAGMDFSIDAHSAAEENRARRFEMRHSSTVGGSVGFGPWSVNASMTNSIGMVNTSQSHRSEEMNQQVNMNADIELHFHSDYMPLNQLAAADSVQRIRAVSLNPEAPARTPAAARNSADRQAARSVVSTPIAPVSAGTPPPIRQHPTGGSGSSGSAASGSGSRPGGGSGGGSGGGGSGGGSGTPASASTPASGTPASGTPASGTPASGTPASGASGAGRPASGGSPPAGGAGTGGARSPAPSGGTGSAPASSPGASGGSGSGSGSGGSPASGSGSR